MRHRTTFVLLVLFLTGMGVLWWADKADVPTREQRQERLNRLLPELIDTPVSKIQRVEIDRTKGPQKDLLRLERTGTTGWQIVAPTDTAADPELTETFVRNLKDLRKSAVAGTIEGDPAEYGLKEPEAVVRVYGESPSEPLATIELGKAAKDRGYVRSGGATGIEVVDPRRLGAATLPVTAWRDTALFRLPSFRVKGLTVQENGPGAPLEIERDDRRWRLVSPIKVPADNDKAEGLVAELTALRVPEEGGFVAENVGEVDRAAFGLDTPSMTITMTPFEGAGKPQVLRLGKAVPGKPDEVYAMRGDQDEVVRLDVKRLREAMPGPNGLRSQAVLDLTPARIDRVRIDTPRAHFDLSKTPTGWTMLSPVKDQADSAAVQALLIKLSELKASEFLDTSRVANPGLDAVPPFRVRGWEPAPGAVPSKSATKEPKDEPRFDLVLGRHDVVKNTVYGRVAGDSTILALPDSILEQLPRSTFAYRDRTILSVKPPDFARITVERERSSVTIESPPTTGATRTKWTMVAPVAAPADDSAVTSLLLTLGNLKAESWVSDRVGDGKAFGLDAPWLRVKWELQAGPGAPTSAGAGVRRGVLRLGTVNPKGGSVFGNIEGDERVFLLNAGVVVYLEAELHSHKVMTFKADDAARVVIRWPSRTISVDRALRSPGTAAAWEVTPGFDPTGFDASRVGDLVSALSSLTTPRFLQYTGPLPAESGLTPPRVAVEVKVAGLAEALTLRVGRKMNESASVATNTAGAQGAVFVLPAGAWADVLKRPGRPDELPEDVFTPEPARPGPPLPTTPH